MNRKKKGKDKNMNKKIEEKNSHWKRQTLKAVDQVTIKLIQRLKEKK